MSKLVAVVGLLVLVFLALIVPIGVQANDGFEWTGTIETRPTGVVGTWVIDGRTFQANASTVTEEEDHALTVGSCAEVKYYVSGTTNIATKIQDEEGYHCNGGGGGDDQEHVKLYAQLDAAPPADIHNGTWQIGGKIYTSDANTTFDFTDGEPAAGVCVEIEYAPATPTLLKSLETEADYKCSASGGGGDPEHPYTQVYGVLDNFPAELVGTWTVSGINYVADTSTRFEQEHGGFFVGVCVDVKFQSTNGVNNAVEISVADSYNCGNTGGGGTDPVEDKLYALIDTVPASYTTASTVWTIGGAQFTSNPGSTEFEEEHGVFAPGVCAEVEYYTDNGTKRATKIGTAELYKCNTNTFVNEIYGKIVTLPDGLYGSWVIASSNSITDTYNTGAYTKFEQDNGNFAVDSCVKVKFFVENGVNKAVKIETESLEHCGGQSGNEPPSLPGDSKVYALLDSFPGGTLGSMNLGTWIIGGEIYTADNATEYSAEHGDFAAGVCVKAKYYVETGGSKILTEVETANPKKCQQAGGGSDEFRGYGVIETMPTIFSSPGTWTISGIDYETTVSTQYEQEHGFFAPGAYVEVKYTAAGGVNTATSIETHVAPNAGLDTTIGTLQGQPDLDGDGWDDWTVDGSNFYSDHAIEVNSSLQSGTPRVSGATPVKVLLNTYLGLDGKTYVTYAAKVQQVYLPVIFR